MSTQKTYKVDGMHCASCVALIEDKLGALPGVSSVSVKLTSESAVVDFSGEPVDVNKLTETISPFGYKLKDTEEFEKKNSNHDHGNMLGMEDEGNKEIKYVLGAVAVSFFMMFWQALSERGFAPEMSENTYEFFHHLMPVLAAFVLFGIGRRYIKAVWIFIKTRTANMDTLVGVSTVVAFLYSFIISAFETQLSPYIDVHSSFYDVVVVVIGLIAYGQHLEKKAKRKTNESLKKLASLASKSALIVRDGVEIEVGIESVLKGDTVIVKPNERIPLDGVVARGGSSVDESNLTGESLPVDKVEGDLVFAGTQNFQGVLHILIQSDPKDTALAHIIKIVENAQNSKAKIERTADKISGVFVYVVIALSIVTLFSWIIFGSGALGFTKSFALGLSTMMAVLVIACPCSLGLATPTAIIAGVGRGAERGILIKNAESLEKLSKVTALVFDKTGTLTNNKLEIEGIYCKDKNHICDKEHIDFNSSLIYSITKSSNHPISKSVASWLHAQEVKPIEIKNLTEVSGKGVFVTNEDKKYYLGSILYASEITKQSQEKILDSFLKDRLTSGRELYLFNDTEILSIIKIHDSIKEGAKLEIEKLRRLGITIVMATGDNEKTAKSVANSLGINNVRYLVKPEDKLKIVKELKDKGFVVGMIGDGVNDAPALSEADIAISMSDGSDIAIESADIVLLQGDIKKVAESIKLAKKTNNIIWQNLTSSFAYNSIGLPIAGGILYPFFGFLLSPAIAGAIMAFESVTVVTNSLRLKRIKL